MKPPYNVWMGYDPREDLAYQVARHSILSRTDPKEVDVIPLTLRNPVVQELLVRPIEVKDGKLWCPISQAHMATEFAISRFVVPFIQEKGWCLFVDSDIVCLHWKNIVQTEDGPKYIGHIVKQKYRGKVASLDAAGNFTWSRVVGHSVRKNNGKKFVRLNTGNRKGRVVCTEEHLCACVKDPLRPRVEWIEAAKMERLWTVQREDYRLFSEDQTQALIGTMLGDSHISSRGNLTVSHGHKQRAYIEWKQWLLGGSLALMKPGGWTKIPATTLRCKNNAQIRRLRAMLYPFGKKIAKPVLHYLDERALALWYMDDGSLVKRGGKYAGCKPYAALHTEGFSQEDREEIQRYLKMRWGITSTIQGKRHKYSLLSPAGAEILLKLVAPYVHASMEYKLPAELRGGVKYRWNNIHLDYAATLVKTVNPCKTSSQLFDISVEGTHNFVANGSVVHNCFTDIRELFAQADDRYAVMCVKHQMKEQPTGLKMDGQLQQYYARKNWSSVMMIQADHPAMERFTLKDLNERPGRDLHAFYWLKDEEIGELDHKWNVLVGVDDLNQHSLGVYHFTLGGPWFKDWKGGPADNIWLGAKAAMELDRACKTGAQEEAGHHGKRI